MVGHSSPCASEKCLDDLRAFEKCLDDLRAFGLYLLDLVGQIGVPHGRVDDGDLLLPLPQDSGQSVLAIGQILEGDTLIFPIDGKGKRLGECPHVQRDLDSVSSLESAGVLCGPAARLDAAVLAQVA